MNASRFRYPLSLQTVLPDDYRASSDFGSLLELLRELGFWGVELNLSDPKYFNFEEVRGFLASFDLRFSMFATGLTARLHGLSLSHADENERQRSVGKCREMIEWIGDLDTGMIVGLLKGGPAEDAAAARRQFSRSLAEIMPAADARNVTVLVEATNRKETVIANTVDEAVELVGACGSPHARVLPDTYHMVIEESDMIGTLRRNAAHIPSLHLSDDNRCFPGLGKIDFAQFLSSLKGIGYAGRVAIEGNVRQDLPADLRATAEYLSPLLAV
jgi:sugar phosphate isomerase/epimerase